MKRDSTSTVIKTTRHRVTLTRKDLLHKFEIPDEAELVLPDGDMLDDDDEIDFVWTTREDVSRELEQTYRDNGAKGYTET